MKTKIILPVMAAVLMLSGCNDVKEQLGVGRNSPDEFTVVKRAPLSLPPDYGLRPPADGSVSPASNASNAAKGILMGEGGSVPVKGSAENALLTKMGAGAADPQIRSVINEENGYLAIESQTVTDKLIFWENKGPSEEKIPTAVVDPKAEQERIKKNKEEGKAVNEGDVPEIKDKRGTIDKIF